MYSSDRHQSHIRGYWAVCGIPVTVDEFTVATGSPQGHLRGQGTGLPTLGSCSGYMSTNNPGPSQSK